MAKFTNLVRFIEGENVFSELFKTPLFPADPTKLTEDQAKDLFLKLDGEMSPENLHCDGEISAAAARRKAKLFMGAVGDLETLGFAKPADVWCI